MFRSPTHRSPSQDGFPIFCEHLGAAHDLHAISKGVSPDKLSRSDDIDKVRGEGPDVTI